MTSLTDLITNKQTNNQRIKINLPWIWDVMIVLILIIAAIFRFTGLDWDAGYHLHPDERFLTMVEGAISPVQNISEYFNTATSSLNPNNRGYTFYVYGTLPIFIVRYIGELLGQTGYDQINLVGRVVSGVFDLGTILFIYLIGKKLYKNTKLGLAAALFSALAVLQIQLSHYFTVDTTANFFAYAAIYAAVCIIMANFKPLVLAENEEKQIPTWKQLILQSSQIGPYIAFGLLFGMAIASKISLYALAFLLPIASIIYYSKLPKEYRIEEVKFILRNLVIAGIIAVVTFRIFQPYAFMGPGFFGIKINPGWIASLKELSTISKGEVDVPYALQWARRSLSFAPLNLVKWGVGLSLGVTGLFGFLWMGWRSLKGDWQKHLLIWGWVAFILVTQSTSHVRSMRYLLPLYPALCLIASWTIFKLWENGSGAARKINRININWRRVLALTTAVITIIGTVGWAIAFTSIYTRPVTRVAASEWIYQNISSAIEMPINQEDGTQVNQLLAYQNTALISSATPYVFGFTANSSESIGSVTLEHVLFSTQNNPSLTTIPEVISLVVTLREVDGGDIISTNALQSNYLQTSNARGNTVEVLVEPSVQLIKNKDYEIVFSVAEPDVYLKLDGGIWLTYGEGKTETRQYIAPPAFRITMSSPYQVSFAPQITGTVSEIRLNRIVDLLNKGETQGLVLTIADSAQPDQVLSIGRISSTFTAVSDPRGEESVVKLDQPITLIQGVLYIMKISVENGSGEFAIYNDATVVESSWDDALPLIMYGYNVFDYSNGLYGNNRNMELYYDEDETKRELLYTILDQSDAIFISSNRQWGTITRIDERYPMTTEYYRALIGCPEDQDLLTCYQTAKPGMYNEELGFKLTAVFQSDPTVTGIEINDQSSEEAFTVYDHPKVLIFEKTENYDPEKVREILGSVDITAAVHKTPRQASSYDGNLLLDEEETEIQQSGGTWSELFPADSPLNTQPWLAVIVWYLAISLLGLIAYPIVRVVFHGLPDHGYPFSRLAGLMLTAYLTWLASSTYFSFSRLTIGIVLGILLVVSGLLFYRQREALLEEIKTKKKYFLTIELVVLVLFLISLGIRYGNPDLWHPWKGGEKPMDLSYFTAVLKSSVFPPYDPWFAGGYINYYYFGFVLVGVLVKLLGIVPAVAYNLILPTLFAFTGVGAFSIGWNLFARKQIIGDEDSTEKKANTLRSLLAGIISVFTVLIMGNLGTLRMIWQGLQKIVAPGGVIDNAKFTDRFIWFFQGLGKFFTGAKLPYAIGDWYWIPSRALPGEAITEFPFFTFTYADLHAHMIGLPITILVIGWGLGILFNKWDWKSNHGIRPWVNLGLTLLFGSVAIGMLRVTNTWDFPTYLLLSSLIIIYTIIRYAQLPEKLMSERPAWLRKLVYTVGILVALVGFTILFYLPFSENYAQAYGSISLWTTDHSPLSSYLVHWGVQLFILTTWFVWETREWLASTPVSSLRKLQPYAGYLQTLAILFGAILIIITVLGVKIGWVAGLLGAWSLVLMLRPGQSDAKRLVFFITGTALVLTLFVEMFVLVGDIGRMNTVFKFYYQAWTFFGLASAAALVWLIPAVTTKWKTIVSSIWQVVIAVLIFGAALYPVTAATDKIRDRMSSKTPATLDGLEFMKTSTYNDAELMYLGQDYDAIQWMQQNVDGSPVIVEANTVEYRWGNRFTIYTGLPGVLGWNWHQRQQRGSIDSNGIANRLNEITEFYTTTDVQVALDFLDTYDVSYIILGQMELSYYPGDGLTKFEKYNGLYWKEVFREQDTVIYQVIDGQ